MTKQRFYRLEKQSLNTGLTYSESLSYSALIGRYPNHRDVFSLRKFSSFVFIKDGIRTIIKMVNV